MSSDRELPPSDRAEQPDPPEPRAPETFSEKLRRLARLYHPKKMAEADTLAAREASLRGKPRSDDGLDPITGARRRVPGEEG